MPAAASRFAATAAFTVALLASASSCSRSPGPDPREPGAAAAGLPAPTAASDGDLDAGAVARPARRPATTPPGHRRIPLGVVGGLSVEVVVSDEVCTGGDQDADEEPAARWSLELVEGGAVAQGFGVESVTMPVACWADGDTSGLLEVGDFDFDGASDFAMVLDGSGPYGSPTYAVFLRRGGEARFVRAPAFEELTQSAMGLFTADAATKTLTTFGKAGCCIHFTSTYDVLGDEPRLRESKTITLLGSCEVVTSRRLRDGSMETTTTPCPPDGAAP